MANTTVKTVIQVRRDSTANWETNKNVVPAAGEPCMDLDTGLVKWGNGVDTYENLKISGAQAHHYEGTKTGEENDMAVIDRVLKEAGVTAEKDDIFIVKALIAGAKYSYTAYVYNGEDWAAMDGNYSADNVYFDSDLTYTANIGVLTVPSSGSGTIAASGKSVKSVLSSMIASEKNPATTQPAVSCVCGQLGAYEVGTSVTPSYAATLSAGSYTYGPATGIKANTWSVTLGEETLTTATGSFKPITVTETPQSISATATHDAGAIPNTNLPGGTYPAGQIKAGSKTATAYKANNAKGTTSFSGYRNMFWGPVKSDVELTSANIRALVNKKQAAAGTLPTFGAGSGAVKVIVAVPVGRTLKSVLMPSAMNADATANFKKHGSTIEVEGANGYKGTAYNVYVYQPASIDSTETYSVTIG